MRRFSPGPLWGYLPASGLLEPNLTDTLPLLDLSGRTQTVPLIEVKYVCFVRDLNTADSVNPERLTRKTFPNRPRAEGLWVRMHLRDGDLIEGLAALDASFADGWVEDRGVHLVPPDVRGNTQRLYIPRSAMAAFEVMAVVTSPSRRKTAERAATEQDRQPGLFPLDLPPGARTQ